MSENYEPAEGRITSMDYADKDMFDENGKKVGYKGYANAQRRVGARKQFENIVSGGTKFKDYGKNYDEANSARKKYKDFKQGNFNSTKNTLFGLKGAEKFSED